MKLSFVMALMALGMFCTAAEAQQTFGGYECTEDCSGHQAGYDWAREHNITDPDDCGGDSQSFVEGCKVYTENPYRGSEYDDDGNEIGD